MTRRTREEIGPLTPERKEELNRLAARRDSEIDTSDIPPVTNMPSGAIRGKDWKHYRGSTIVLTDELHAYFSALADRKGISISALVNDFLAREVAVVEAVK